MPTPHKETVVQAMTEKFNNATSIYLADFTGIDVATVTALRKEFREANVEYKVVKNTLAKLSLHNAGIESLDEYLSGVNSYMIGYDDPTTPIRIVKKMRKELEGKFDVKAAYLDGAVINRKDVETLADLPSQEELRAQIVGLVQAPMTKLVGTLQAPLRNMIGVLKAQAAKESE